MINTTIWIALFVIFVVVEATTYQLVSTWFAIGAACAALCAQFGLGTMWQTVVFLAVSIACLALLRPLSVKHFKGHTVKTNVDSLLGDKVLITDDVDNLNGTGKGKLNGMEWTVRSADGEPIPAGETAYVSRIEGVKLIVSKSKGE